VGRIGKGMLTRISAANRCAFRRPQPTPAARTRLNHAWRTAVSTSGRVAEQSGSTSQQRKRRADRWIIVQRYEHAFERRALERRGSRAHQE
jgi:hypothetical protein